MTSTNRWTLTTISVCIVGLLCALIFLGWQLDRVILRSLFIGAPQTVPLTAVLLLMQALSLLLCQRTERGPAPATARWGCWVLAGGSVALSLWILIQYLFHLGPGVGLIFYHDLVLQQSATFPGRPSPHTALTAFLVGVAIVLYVVDLPRWRRVGLVCMLSAFCISWVVLFGYANQANPFYSLVGSPEIGMSPLTVLGFTGLIVGVIGLRPDDGLLSLLRAPTSGGQVVRFLLPVAALMPLFFGLLINYGLLAGWLEPILSFSLTWGISSLVYIGLVIWQGSSLHHHDIQREQIAAEREHMLEELATAAEQIRRVNLELEEQAEALDRSNQELLQFAYVASHDLQAPLRSISGYVQLLQADYEGKFDERADDWMVRILRATNRLQTLIHDLLAYSQVNSKGFTASPVAMEEVLQESLILLDHEIRESNAQISWDPLPVVSGEHTQLVQLMLNLFGNALKYRSNQPPRIHVHVQEQMAQGHEMYEMIVLGVEDNGIGIDEAYFDKVFEIFNRLHTGNKYAGTGIGLAVCRRIVTRHHGQIWLESTPGAGSTFYVSLPKSDEIDRDE